MPLVHPPARQARARHRAVRAAGADRVVGSGCRVESAFQVDLLLTTTMLAQFDKRWVYVHCPLNHQYDVYHSLNVLTINLVRISIQAPRRAGIEGHASGASVHRPVTGRTHLLLYATALA